MQIQNDTVDLMARDLMPFIAKHVSSILNELSPQDQLNVTTTLKQLSHWHGEMHETSIGATIYSVWQYHFYQTLFVGRIQDEKLRLQITSNYPFSDYIQRVIKGLAQDPENESFNMICQGAFH